jgi:malonyl-CoA O-methyltransferase
MAMNAMTTSESDISARFSAAATTYDRAITVHDQVATDLLALFPEAETPDHILEPGCGTGLLTRKLLARFPQARIDAFDLSPEMIAQAQRDRPSGDTLNHRVAGFEEASANWGSYDVIMSSAALHWAPSLRDAIQALDRCLAPGGRFHCAFMLDGTLSELHRARRAVVSTKPVRAALPTLEEGRSAFEAMGWTSEHVKERSYQATLPNARAVLQQIHEQGVTGGDVSHGHLPLTRGELVRLQNYYDTHFATENGVSVTSVVGFFSYRKP